MIYGIGIDSVQIERFSDFKNIAHRQLARIFSDEEITYCLATPINSAERFAVRFAAREALWKAFSTHTPTHSMPFFAFCKNIFITHSPNGAPKIGVHWDNLASYLPTKFTANFTTHLSLTHTRTTASAFVILSTH